MIDPFLGDRVIDGLLWGAIADDKHLEVLDGLSSHALQCERQIDRRPDEWEQNGEAGRHVLLYRESVKSYRLLPRAEVQCSLNLRAFPTSVPAPRGHAHAHRRPRQHGARTM